MGFGSSFHSFRSHPWPCCSVRHGSLVIHVPLSLWLHMKIAKMNRRSLRHSLVVHNPLCYWQEKVSFTKSCCKNKTEYSICWIFMKRTSQNPTEDNLCSKQLKWDMTFSGKRDSEYNILPLYGIKGAHKCSFGRRHHVLFFQLQNVVVCSLLWWLLVKL